jgi:hypothetical protein
MARKAALTQLTTLEREEIFVTCPECNGVGTVDISESNKGQKECVKCRGQKWELSKAGEALQSFVKDFKLSSDGKQEAGWTLPENPSNALEAFLKEFRVALASARQAKSAIPAAATVDKPNE